MTGNIRIRAQLQGTVTEVKTLLEHPMESGNRRDGDSGERVPAHYIQEIVCEHNGQVVMTAYWGPAVAKNPFWSLRINGGRPGDTIRIRWIDNRGETAAAETTIT
jgi:sulfur-oxidizing protein SoxZ